MRLRAAIACVALLGLALIVILAFNELPSLADAPNPLQSRSGDTRIGRAVGPQLSAHPGLSGILP